MLNCQEVHRIAAEDIGEPKSLMRRIELKLHLMMCGKCSRYIDQLRAIGNSVRELCAPRPGDDETVARIEREVMAGHTPPPDGKDAV